MNRLYFGLSSSDDNSLRAGSYHLFSPINGLYMER